MNVNILCFKGLKLFCFNFKQLKTILSFIWTRLNCDDNDDAMFPDTRAFAFTRRTMKRNFTWSIRAIHLHSSTAFLFRLKFWIAKKSKMKLRIAPTETSFCKLSRPCKNSRCFQKKVQLFNIMRIMLLT